MLEYLFESSSLQPQILQKVKNVIYDIVDNINMDDELLARVNDETYKFIKGLKKWENKNLKNIY